MSSPEQHDLPARDREVSYQTIRLKLVGSLNRLADFFLPPLCLGCRRHVSAHDALCGECWSRVDFIVEPYCDVLGIPLSYSAGERIVSAAALANPPVYDRARAVAHYDGVMRDLVHSLKYGDRHEGVKLMSRWLDHAGAVLLCDADVIIPVPLARTRLWSRRFNQAALLAQKLAVARNIPANLFALERTRRTMSQVGLSADQRKRNVAGAFKVPLSQRPKIENRNILLVDDVVTTGATANACARALKKAGAARVDVLALARVVDPLAPSL